MSIKERPILFSGPMVRAILESRKTQTRRYLSIPVGWCSGQLGTITSKHPKQGKFGLLIRREIHPGSGKFELDLIPCPYGKVGDRLWVRESHYLVHQQGNPKLAVIEIDYKAGPDTTQRMCPQKWRPSIHMPRWASRITLEITDIRVERLQDISEEDAEAEGICDLSVADHALFGLPGEDLFAQHPVRAFQLLWESINGVGSWAQNPWVWVIEFRRVV